MSGDIEKESVTIIKRKGTPQNLTGHLWVYKDAKIFVLKVEHFGLPFYILKLLEPFQKGHFLYQMLFDINMLSA
eukprot:7697959-Ditylum_brightwellii.AAC.1